MKIERKYTGEPFAPSSRTKETYNTKINKFKHFTEVMYFNEPFEVWYGKRDYENVDVETGEKVGVKELSQAKYEMIERTLGKEYAEAEKERLAERSQVESRKRAKDTFYGYALCNDWLYFCTFTIAKNDYDSSDDATKVYWKVFRQRLQRKFADIKILGVPERHKSGNIHFHALLGDCDLEHILVVAISPKTNQPIFQNGRQVYNLPLWSKGFSTVVKIDENKERTVNYMIGYITKQDEMGWKQKRYYRTKNLDFKETELTFTRNVDNLHERVEYGEATLHKETGRMLVFRIPNRPPPEPEKFVVGQVSIGADGSIVQPELPRYEHGMRVLTAEEAEGLPW